MSNIEKASEQEIDWIYDLVRKSEYRTKFLAVRDILGGTIFWKVLANNDVLIGDKLESSKADRTIYELELKVDEKRSSSKHRGTCGGDDSCMYYNKRFEVMQCHNPKMIKLVKDNCYCADNYEGVNTLKFPSDFY
jgi:hypothetical protein